jgi:type I restriction enzyme S subunit
VLQEDDVLFTIAGTIGRVARVNRDILPANTNQAVAIVRPDREVVDPRFLYYVLRDEVRVRHALTRVVQSVQANFSLTELSGIEVPLPTRAEQRAIADILGTLDDKIESNRRINQTLEAMARAFFKAWFVDFDPVRAKVEGRDPGLSQPLADLFPDSFEDSELGKIPKGWKVSSIGLAADVIDCLHSKKPERREAGMPLLQLANIRDDGLIDMEDSYFIDEADYYKWVSRMEALPGDCVITNVGRVGAVAQMPVGQKAALGRNMTGVRCKPSFPFPTVLIECLLSQAMREEIALKMDTGTILDALNVRNIPRLRFVRPRTCDILEYFERDVRPLRAQMERHLSESRTLAALRDALLPKLMSGELRVQTQSE